MSTASSTGSSSSVVLKKGVDVLQREKDSDVLSPMGSRLQMGDRVSHGPVENLICYGDPVEAVPVISPKLATGIYVLMSDLSAATK